MTPSEHEEMLLELDPFQVINPFTRRGKPCWMPVSVWWLLLTAEEWEWEEITLD